MIVVPRSAYKDKHNKAPKVIKHLKGDIKTFKHEAEEDRELIHELKKKPHSKKHSMHVKKDPKSRIKMHKVMEEFEHGALHSGSKKGPRVSNRKQAIAIGLSEARKAGAHIPKKRK